MRKVNDEDFWRIKTLREIGWSVRDVSNHIKRDEKQVRYWEGRSQPPSARSSNGRPDRSGAVVKRRRLVKKLAQTTVAVQQEHITPKLKKVRSRVISRPAFSSPSKIARQLWL